MGTNKTGGHWRPCNVRSVEVHNERRPDYLESVEKSGLNLYFFQDLTKGNSSWVNNEEKYRGKTVAEIFENEKKLYKEKFGQAPQLAEKKKVNKKTGRVKTVAGWSPLREMCPPIKEDTKLEDFDYFRKWAKKYNLNIVRIDLHKDEGFIDSETGEQRMNYHAHIVGDFLDWDTGKTIKLGPEVMSEMQTILAMSLNMERGQRKADTGVKGLAGIEYKTKKANEEQQRLEEKIKEKDEELKRIETKIKGLSTMVANLQQQKEAIEIDISALEEEYEERGKMSQEEYEKKMAEYNEKLANVNAKLEDKQDKLNQANAELEHVTATVKSMADSGIRREDLMRQKLARMNEELNHKRQEIKKADHKGEIRNAEKAIKAREDIIYRHWPEARSAVNAIFERTNSSTATLLSAEQAFQIENALRASGMDRQAAANDLLSLAQKGFDDNRTWSGWISDIAKELKQLVEHVHPLSALLQQDLGTGGGGGVAGELTNWDGTKKKGMGV